MAMDRNYEKLKRGADFVLSAAGLLLFLPVMAGAAVACGRSGQGILCRQERIGKDGRPFQLYKFRTLRRDAPLLPREAFPDMARYFIKGGSFLRSSGIDELPQLWNVLWGEMSLVGPRPLLAEEGGVHRMRQRAGVYTLRPGITGLAQLCGDPPARVKGSIDRIYRDGCSLALDAAILWSTLLLLWKRQREQENVSVPRAAKILLNIWKSPCNLSQNVVS